MSEDKNKAHPRRTEEFDYDQAEERGEYLWRVRMLAVILPGSLGVVLLLGRLVADKETLYNINLLFGFYSFSLVVAIAFGITGLGLMFMYLQTGLQRRRFIYDYAHRMNRRWQEANRTSDLANNEEGSETLSSEEPEKPPLPEVAGVASDAPAQNRRAVEHLSAEDYDSITHRVMVGLGEDFFGRLSKEFDERFSVDVVRRRKIEHSSRETTEMIDRLREESRRLNFRGNLNLLIGITITAIGIYALFYYVSAMKPLADNQLAWRFVEHFLPRLSLVIFIEIFAYFFLRLYKESLADIKYYQNEITNAQSRRLAVLLSAWAPSHEIMGVVIGKLADTERNYVLRKDESTPDLKRAELERATTTAMLKEISTIVRAGIPGAVKSEAKDKSE